MSDVSTGVAAKAATLVSFENTSVTYPNGFTALTDVNLELHEGEFIVVVGLLWTGLLKLCGLPVEPQDAVAFFKKAQPPALLATMIALAALDLAHAARRLSRSCDWRSGVRREEGDDVGLGGRVAQDVGPGEVGGAVAGFEPAWSILNAADRKQGWRPGGFQLFEVVGDQLIAGMLGGEPFQRRGYMREAILALTHHAFTRLDLSRLEAACLPTNGASRRVLEKAGFRRTGEQSHRFSKGRGQAALAIGLVRDADGSCNQDGGKLMRAA